MTQLAVSRGKNCILGFRMKPHWFHKKLHTPISLHCKISVFFKPLWFHQELEYAICETTLVSSEIGVGNTISAGDTFLAWWCPPWLSLNSNNFCWHQEPTNPFVWPKWRKFHVSSPRAQSWWLSARKRCFLQPMRRVKREGERSEIRGCEEETLRNRN